LLAHGRLFSPGTPVSSTTKTGRHDIAEALLKVALNTKNQSIIQSINHVSDWLIFLNSSPLKPLGQMNRNLVESIYLMSSIKNAHFVSIQ
jgi:hypothetical protein